MTVKIAKKTAASSNRVGEAPPSRLSSKAMIEQTADTKKEGRTTKHKRQIQVLRIAQELKYTYNKCFMISRDDDAHHVPRSNCHLIRTIQDSSTATPSAQLTSEPFSRNRARLSSPRPRRLITLHAWRGNTNASNAPKKVIAYPPLPFSVTQYSTSNQFLF